MNSELSAQQADGAVVDVKAERSWMDMGVFSSIADMVDVEERERQLGGQDSCASQRRHQLGAKRVNAQICQ